MEDFWYLRKNRVELLPRKKKVDFRDSSRPDEFVRYGLSRVGWVES